MHLNKDRRGKSRNAPKAEDLEAVNLGFAPDCNSSEYKLYIEETGKITIWSEINVNLTEASTELLIRLLVGHLVLQVSYIKSCLRGQLPLSAEMD
jgi:hypothetical protein